MEDENKKNTKLVVRKKRLLSDTYKDENDRNNEVVSFTVREDNQNTQKMHFVNSKEEEMLAKGNDYLDSLADENFNQEKKGERIESEHDVSDIDYNNYAQEIDSCEGSELTIAGLKPINEGIPESLEKIDAFDHKSVERRMYDRENAYETVYWKDMKTAKTLFDENSSPVENFTGIRPEDDPFGAIYKGRQVIEESQETENKPAEDKPKDKKEKKEDKGLTL